MQLVTERLILRKPELSDAEAIYLQVSDYMIARTTLNIPHPYPREAAVQFIENVSKSLEEGRDYTFAATLHADGTLLGMCGIHPEARFDRAEIGYWFGVSHWGKGYASEAARRLVQFGFEDLNLERVYASYFVCNPASRRVMEKAGMTYEATLRHHVKRLGVYHDVGYCGILRSEWFARQEV